VREILLATIRKTARYVQENEAEFAEKLREAAAAVKQSAAANAHKKELAKNERRIAELQNLFRKTYEDNASGKLTDEWFAELSGGYERERSDLTERNIVLQAEIDVFAEDSIKADKFIELVRQYTEFDELTTPMINEFIDKVIVYAPDKSSGERRQQVDVYLSYIGKFDVPGEEYIPTAEELETARKRLEKRIKSREYAKRHYAKRKAEILAEKAAAEQKSA
jgi:hypothetical protein